MGDFTMPFNRTTSLDLVPVNPSPPSRSMPFREDCWSEEATGTLVDAWGRRYLELNRGNLRQKDWQEVADAVNERHGHTKKTMRTDVQCKNRIDTIKKKYKIEKARVIESNGAFVSAWPFFEKLDVLIGPKKSEAFTRRMPPVYNGLGRAEAFPRTGTPPMAIALQRDAKQLPVAVAVTPQKRTASVVDDSYFRRNYSAMAAAAAKGEEEDDDEEMSEEEETEERGVERGEERGGKQGEMDGMKMLAKAIERLGETYERVEMEKLRQMMELEKKRLDAGREVELQRMQLLSDLQIQFEKARRTKEKAKKSSGLDSERSSILLLF